MTRWELNHTHVYRGSWSLMMATLIACSGPSAVKSDEEPASEAGDEEPGETVEREPWLAPLAVVSLLEAEPGAEVLAWEPETGSLRWRDEGGGEQRAQRVEEATELHALATGFDITPSQYLRDRPELPRVERWSGEMKAMCASRSVMTDHCERLAAVAEHEPLILAWSAVVGNAFDGDLEAFERCVEPQGDVAPPACRWVVGQPAESVDVRYHFQVGEVEHSLGVRVDAESLELSPADEITRAIFTVLE